MRFWSSSSKSGAGSKKARRPDWRKSGTDLYLSDACEGCFYTMVGLEKGNRFREKVYSMGLNPGVRFKILINSGHGPVELEVRQTKLAIGRGMTQKIKIRENGS